MKKCRSSQPQNRKSESKATPGGQKKRPRGPQVDQKGVQGDPRGVQGDPKGHQKAMFAEGPWGPECREEVRSSSPRLQAQSELLQINIMQTNKKQSPSNTAHYLTRTGVPEGTVRIFY